MISIFITLCRRCSYISPLAQKEGNSISRLGFCSKYSFHRWLYDLHWEGERDKKSWSSLWPQAQKQFKQREREERFNQRSVRSQSILPFCGRGPWMGGWDVFVSGLRSLSNILWSCTKSKQSSKCRRGTRQSFGRVSKTFYQNRS